MFTYVCTHCGGAFSHRKKGKKFCGILCFHAWSKGRINRGPKSNETKAKISASMKGRPLGKQTPEHSTNIARGKLGKKFTVEHCQALSSAKVAFLQRGGFHGRQSTYVSRAGETMHAHSSWELERMKMLDADPSVASWTKNHRIVIDYEHEGRSRRYVPDFWVSYVDGRVELQEVKGFQFEPTRCAAKAEAGRSYCQARGWSYRVLGAADIGG